MLKAESSLAEVVVLNLEHMPVNNDELSMFASNEGSRSRLSISSDFGGVHF